MLRVSSHFSQSQLRSDQEISKNHKRKVSALHGGAFGRARSGPDTFVADDLVLSPEEREKRMALALQATSMLGMPGESGEAREETLGCEKKGVKGMWIPKDTLGWLWSFGVCWQWVCTYMKDMKRIQVIKL